VLNSALGVKEQFGPLAPPNCRAIEIGGTLVQNGTVAYAFRIFGRPPRTSTCDCERAMEPALPQTLYLMTDPILYRKLQGGRLQELLASEKPDEQILEELFLATLCRYPTDKDKKLFTEHRATKNTGVAARDRRDAFVDTLWALINTREFILNH
jgi:hypothetical protein